MPGLPVPAKVDMLEPLRQARLTGLRLQNHRAARQGIDAIGDGK